MKLYKTLTWISLCFTICLSNLNAQYDGGTVIYNQTSSTNLTSISKNYIVEDFDGDFNADVIMVKSNTANNAYHLTWYKGDGSGNFTPQNNIMSVNSSHRNNEIFYEDMNEDGIKDIVFQNSDSGFKILLNDGQGNISTQIDNEVITGNPFEADLKEITDVDGDGDIDGIFWTKIESTNYGHYLGYCLIGYNNGNGIFSNYTYLDDNNPEMFFLIETGDIDEDGDLDIVCTGNIITQFDGSVFTIEHFGRLYRNTGTSGYVAEELDFPVGTTFSNIKINDIDNDGNDELLIEFAGSSSDLHGGIYLNNPRFQVLDYETQMGTLTTLETYDSWLHNYFPNVSVFGSSEFYNNIFHMQFGNQNNDSNSDILSINASQGRLQWYLGDGNGNFNNTQIVNINNQYSSFRPVLRVADIDNDSDLDIFVLLNDDTSSTLTVFKNLTLSPVCPPVLDLTNNAINNGVYQADITTISSGNVVTGDNVLLKAGANVKLQSGFRVPVNTRLNVAISPCN